jgi:7,8-dihydropterin-6-yl-methyl-4-(beta-D-ribofuranosyl)aminobenzene 5'-phosphate synthase
MSKKTNFGETQNVAITVLVDNRADLIVKSTDTVKYLDDTPLLAEHGFAALVDLKAAEVRILWDAGLTRTALLENIKRIKIDPATIDKIALSHGHDDHTAAVADVLRAMDLKPKSRKWEPGATPEEIRQWVVGRRVPVIAHPAAFRERWGIPTDGTKYGPVLPPSRAEWEALGAEIILPEGPYELGPGCWTTGSVPRLSFETSGVSSTEAYREGDAFIRDYIDEDQAIVVNVKDKGLVILSGCAHSGIVNTVNYARAISGVDEVWAILGGFHLAEAKDEEIRQTIDEIKRCQPRLIVPSHCTGFKAMCQFAVQMPDEFLPGVVGATYLF